jgi:hypothetical protein
MLTAAANFHNARFLGIFTVFAAVLAVFLSTTVAGRVSTLLIVVVSHSYSSSGADRL